MSERKAKLHQDLSDAVVNLDEELAATAATAVIAEHFDAYQAVEGGLAHGMDRAGRLFEEDEYFVPELLLAADAMYVGLDILKPHITVEDAGRGKVVIGVVAGDTHDIGKNLVRIILETKGFEVLDLGRDVLPATFVDKAREIGADIIALSTLMTTTMPGMAEVIELLTAQGLRDRIRVMVGGAPVSAAFAKRIGADGYAANATEAGELAVRLVATTRAGQAA